MADRFAAEGMKVVLADIESDALARAESEMKGASAEVASKVTDVSRSEDVEEQREKVDAVMTVIGRFRKLG